MEDSYHKVAKVTLPIYCDAKVFQFDEDYTRKKLIKKGVKPNEIDSKLIEEEKNLLNIDVIYLV